MKKAIIAAALSVLAASTVLTGAVNYKKNITDITTVSENDTHKYILKDYNGRIAVYYEGSETPNEIFEIYTRTLPAEDAEKIENGIEINGPDKLSEILADYTS